MHTWQFQEAKAKLSKVMNLCLAEGPQTITRRGQEEVTMVATAEWKRLTEGKKLNIKDWLMTDFARTDDLVPEKNTIIKLRPPMTFED